VRLKDIAQIEDGLSDFRQLARFNGRQAVGLGIVKIPNTNTVAIVDKVRARLDSDILPTLPPGMQIDIVQNDSVFIREIINSLKEHLVEGTLLAGLVVLFFLRSVRSTIIIALAIPVSLLGSVAVMYFFGYTFNSVTMLALLLLIGVVVDDSIVVLENIFRHREHLDPDPISAAMNGSREVTFAVLAATLSLISIFAPVIFIGGIIGQFFKSFAVVVTFGVLVSWFVALTLTPMLCSRFLRVHKHEGRVHRALDRVFAGMDNSYRWFLERALRHRWKVLVATLLVVLSSQFFFKNVGKELAPQQDEGRFLISMRTPLGSSIEYTDRKLREVEALTRDYPEIVTEWGIIGLGSAQQVNQATLVIRMLPKAERRAQGMRSQQQVLNALRRELTQVAGVRAFPRPFGVFPGQRTEPLQFVVTGPNLMEMGRHATDLQRRLQADPAIGRMDTDLQLELPQYILAPDRTRTQAFGLSSQDVALALNMLTGGIDIAKYNDDPGDGQRYDVRVKAADGEFVQQGDLAKIYLRNRQGQLIRLDSVASFKEVLGPAVIGKFDLEYAATFYNIPSVTLGAAIDRVNEAGRRCRPATACSSSARRRSSARPSAT